LNLLVDTNIVLWTFVDSPRLSAKTRQMMTDGGLVYISAASVWEIAIKRTLGKLKCPDDLELAISRTRFIPLSVTVAHGITAGGLPRHHDDPFDRMIIAQAMAESLMIITSDERFSEYDVRVMLI
jgi:PIN domain nuclease of toxin-antitoxin system